MQLSLFLSAWSTRLVGFDMNINTFLQMPRLNLQSEEGSTTFSFYLNTKKRLVTEFERVRDKYSLNNIVLVLDLPSARIISTLFSTTELVQFSVVFVERLEVVRKKLEHHAIYFITPSKESIAAMLKDFESDSHPQYRKAHVLFTGSLEESLMREVSKSRNFLKKLARHSFKQFYCQLQIISNNCIHMNIPYLPHAFSRDNQTEKEARTLIGRRFVDLVAAYPKLHTVRILYDQETANKVAERVVERGAREIKGYLTKLLENKSVAIDSQAPDLTIFVVDRSIDVISPVLHGYAYESLLYDILNEGGKSGEEYQQLPRQIFDEFRYRHISHALQQLPKRLNEVLASISGGKLDAMELRQRIDQKEKLNVHVQLLHRLFEKYQEKKLTGAGELEISLATGVTEDGKQTSSSDLVATIYKQIKNNKVLDFKELVRLAILALACVKLSKEDYQTLVSLFKEEDKAVLLNMAALGVSYDKKIAKSTKNIERSAMDRPRQLLQENSIPSERFESALEITLPRLIELLSKDPKGTGRSHLGERVISVTSKEDLLPKFDSQRLICFMCGGLSQTEICSIRRDRTLDSVVLATDSILTPEEFVESVRKIDVLVK